MPLREPLFDEILRLTLLQLRDHPEVFNENTIMRLQHLLERGSPRLARELAAILSNGQRAL
jgi:hypothetical protein